jgi:beta-galactosidase
VSRPPVPPGAEPGVWMDRGALRLGGRRRLLLTGEYPYYRDDPARWPVKLAAIREAGLEVVSFYVPWRHHEAGGGFRFDGPGNRDLHGFLATVGRAGLLALPKPGPYVHAELPLGGLPDRVAPGRHPGRPAAVSATGEPARYLGAALPSGADPGYRQAVAGWLAAVGAALRRWQYPHGPVVAVQVGNEGWHGENAAPIDAVDYSAAAVEAFRRFAPGLEPPRHWSAPSDPDGLLPYLAWGAWAGGALRAGLRDVAGWLGLAVPALANLAPPARADRAAPTRAAGRYDAWYVRGLPDGDPTVHYGYTSWTGDAARDDEALVNYVLAAARGRGPNLEENWSLGWVDPAAALPAVSVYHGLLGLACGATGLSVYTACATAHWGPHLEWPGAAGGDGDNPGPAWRTPPYGEAAPIGVDGTPGRSYAALRVLAHFLAAAGTDLLEASTPYAVRWYGYRPYAAVGAWAEPLPGGVAGRPAPPTVAGSLVPLVTGCLRHRMPFSLAELPDGGGVAGRPAAAQPRPGAGPVVAPAGFFMAAAAQVLLAGFVAAGGRLLLVGELPTLDEPAPDGRSRPCTLLADEIARTGGDRVTVAAPGTGLPAALDGWLPVAAPPGVRPVTGAAARDGGAATGAPELLEFRRTDPAGGTFVFLFNRRDRTRRSRTSVDGADLEVLLCAYGCAVVRVKDGRLAACYVRNVDERTSTGEPVEVVYGTDRVASTGPGEVSVVAGPRGYAVRHTGASQQLTLPGGRVLRR